MEETDKKQAIEKCMWKAQGILGDTGETQILGAQSCPDRIDI